MDEVTVINGQLQTALDVRDRGLAYGHGVFETALLAAGEIPLWHFHSARLARGLEVLRISCRPADVATSLDKLVAACPGDGIVRLTVTAGVAARGYRVVEPLTPAVIAQWFPLPARRPRTVRLAISPHRLPLNPVLAGLKHLNRLDQVLAAAQAPVDCEPLLLDREGRVVEALSHNLFVLAGDRWLTPSLENCGVAGVMRSLLLERVFGDVGETVAVTDLDRQTLAGAAEVFICNSVAGVVPVTALAGMETDYGRTRTDIIRHRLAEVFPCFPA